MVPRQFVVDISDCQDCSSTTDLFNVSKLQDKNRRLHCTSANSASCVSSRNKRVDNVRQTISIKSTFNATANRHLHLNHIQVLPPKPKARTDCSGTVVLPRRPQILTAGERTKLLRFAHMEDPRKRMTNANPITISNNDDFDKVNVMKRKENRMGSFPPQDPSLNYTSGHQVLRPITGSHQDRLFIQNIKSNHIRYNGSSIVDKTRIQYREDYTSLGNFASNCIMDISGDCLNVKDNIKN